VATSAVSAQITRQFPRLYTNGFYYVLGYDECLAGADQIAKAMTTYYCPF
jgi:hypothetical protein